MLRDLAICNPRMVASVNGFSCLVDVVIEPSSPELAEVSKLISSLVS